MAKSLSPLFPKNVFCLLGLYSTLLNVVSSAAINPTHGSLAANGNQCTDNSTWIGTGSSSVDCIGAVQKLYNAEVKPFSDTDFEFLSAKAPARSLPSMRTPRKYTVGESSLSSATPFPLSVPFEAKEGQKDHAPWR